MLAFYLFCIVPLVLGMGVLQVCVTDDQNCAIENMRFYLSGPHIRSSIITGSNGCVEQHSLYPGTYFVSPDYSDRGGTLDCNFPWAETNVYDNQVAKLQLKCNEMNTDTSFCANGGSLSLNILDTAGCPVAFMGIQFRGPNLAPYSDGHGSHLMAITSVDGHVFIDNMQPVAYDLSIVSANVRTCQTRYLFRHHPSKRI
jgi:hypothetical protein